VNQELPKPTFLSVPEAAGLCGVTRNTLFNWVRSGKLKAYQTPGKTNLIRPSDLVRFMESSGMFVPGELAEAARKDAEMQAAESKAVPGAAEERAKVLIVDDDPVVRNVMSRALRDIAPMYLAETGYEALHLLTVHRDIRLVLLDLRMPGQHGLKTLKEIRAAHPEVQVIIVTAYEGEITPDLLTDGSIARLVRKPFRPSEIQKVVTELLAKISP
jgi:excisionase family DNA binding protein